MIEEKDLHNMLDKMILISKRMYAAKDNPPMYEYYAKEMDDLRDEFSKQLSSCSEAFQILFLKGTLEKSWNKLKNDTLAVRAILLDELSRF